MKKAIENIAWSVAILFILTVSAGVSASGDHEPDVHADSHDKPQIKPHEASHNEHDKSDKKSHEDKHGDDSHQAANTHEDMTHKDTAHESSGHEVSKHESKKHETSAHETPKHESSNHTASHDEAPHNKTENHESSAPVQTSHTKPESKKNTHSNVHWGYDGDEGPSHWGALTDEFSLCGKGRQQSPINITHEEEMNLYPLEFHYGQSSNAQVVNNGHTIQVNYAKGSYAIIGRKKYHLLQFHFHSPSEHQVHGKHADMVAHLVHKSNDGDLAVVAVLFKEGRSNHFLDPIWQAMPKRKGEATVHATLSIMDLIPHDTRYFNYAGSLTTPPCSEGVNWNLLTTYMPVSKGQVSDFMHIFSKSIRPIQPINERLIGVK